MTRPASLALLALATTTSCQLASSGGRQDDLPDLFIDDADALNVSVISGHRSFVDSDWRRANDPEMLGVELCMRSGPWALIAAASLGSVDDVVGLGSGAPPADVELSDIFCGLRWYVVEDQRFPLQPYVSLGSGWVGHHVLAGGAWYDPEEEKAAQAFFAQAGVELRITRLLVIGVDTRFVGAGSLRVASEYVDPSYTALVFRVGVGF